MDKLSCCCMAVFLVACSGGVRPSPSAAEAPEDSTEKSAGGEEVAEEQVACRSHDECPSEVCSHFKKDSGFCAPESCATGERADNNLFYCDGAGSWQSSKRDGDACTETYECYESNCFMNPTCDLHPPGKATCLDGKCVTEAAEDICAREGKVRVLAPGEYMRGEDGSCMESIAQHVLTTICVPCGNGACDEGESVCNCPADCGK